MAARNTLNLDTDLGDPDFDNYMANKDVGSPVDIHIRGKVTTKDDSSVTIAVDTVLKIEEWDNSDGEDGGEAPDQGGETDDMGESEDDEKNPILIMIGPGRRRRSKTGSQLMGE